MVSQVRKTDTPPDPGIQVLTDVLGRRVRARRSDLGYSQVELAGYMAQRGHGWVHGTVSRIEKGDVEPTLSELVSLMFVLGSNFGELLDPVLTGGNPVDLGLNEPADAEYARQLLSGEKHVRTAGTRRREVDDG